jgi:hypothetical protein
MYTVGLTPKNTQEKIAEQIKNTTPANYKLSMNSNSYLIIFRIVFFNFLGFAFALFKSK